jgi:hypothetical protein
VPATCQLRASYVPGTDGPILSPNHQSRRSAQRERTTAFGIRRKLAERPSWALGRRPGAHAASSTSSGSKPDALRPSFPASAVPAMFRPPLGAPRVARGPREQQEEVRPGGRREAVRAFVRDEAQSLGGKEPRLEFPGKTARPRELCESFPQKGPVFRALRFLPAAPGTAGPAACAGRDRESKAGAPVPPAVPPPLLRSPG